MTSTTQQPATTLSGSHSTGPAFTAVSARRTLGASPLPKAVSSFSIQAPPPPVPTPRKIDWPPSVREYVQRSFALENAIPRITAEEMQGKLRQVINQAAERDELNQIDWTTFPLPQHLLRDERIAAVQQNAWQQHLAQTKLEHKAIPDANQNLNSKKRKSSEGPSDQDLGHDSSSQLPWRQTQAKTVFEDRITFPSAIESAGQPAAQSTAQLKRAEKRQRKVEEHFAKDSKLMGDLEKRKQRFDLGRPIYPSTPHHSSLNDTPDAPQGPVVGTCQDLEKGYFRLTAPPIPKNVRPIPVLRKTFELLRQKWKKDRNYSYICDQMKSMRQDLTVQHIKNEFTVTVYELHARIALEKNDLGEYNQCQTQLRAFHKQNLGGHPAEFVAYRILYLLHTCNRADMNEVLADLTPADREDVAVKHALGVRSALASGNYHRFFRLFQEVPNMGGYLIDMFLARERLAALAALCKAYKPTVPLRFVCEELGFESDKECAAFICDSHGEELLEAAPNGVIFATGKAGPLFEQAKVAAFKRVDIKGQI